MGLRFNLNPVIISGPDDISVEQFAEGPSWDGGFHRRQGYGGQGKPPLDVV